MRRMMIASVLLLLFAAPAQADQSVTLYLNWKPGPEHVPLLYAQKGGLYEQEGVHVTIEPGTGSGNTLRVVAKDPARLLWPALANGNGIDPQSVTWVNVSNNAKVDALRSGAIDIAVNAFPDSFRLYPDAFGDDLAQLAWRDAGLNLYNLSLIAPTALVRDNPALVRAVVKATQRAVAACLADGAPCIDALTESYPTLRRDEELSNWR